MSKGTTSDLANRPVFFVRRPWTTTGSGAARIVSHGTRHGTPPPRRGGHEFLFGPYAPTSPPEYRVTLVARTRRVRSEPTCAPLRRTEQGT